MLAHGFTAETLGRLTLLIAGTVAPFAGRKSIRVGAFPAHQASRPRGAAHAVRGPIRPRPWPAFGVHGSATGLTRFFAQPLKARGSLLASAMSGGRCLPERYPPAGRVVLHNTRSRIPPRSTPISHVRPDYSAAVGDRWQAQTAHFRKRR
jgi:hypothetical protein